MTRRVMVIVYYWPPSAGSGVQRWLKMTKYFEDFGITPVVVTPENPYYFLKDEGLLNDVSSSMEVIKLPIFEPYKIAELISGKKVDNTGKVKYDDTTTLSVKDKVFKYIRGHYFRPDPRVFWVKPSVKYLKKYLKNNPVDAIITTGPPHSMHMIGQKLKEWDPGLTFIADFRDPMSQLDFMKAFGVEGKLLKKYQKIEYDIVNTADYVTGTSPSMYTKLEKFETSKYRSITNGYDAEDFIDIKENQKAGIELFHAGLLNELRNPIELWKALNELIGEGLDIKLTLAGNIDSGILKLIKTYKSLSNNTEIIGYISHEEVIQRYINADINLLLVNDSHNAQVNIPGKLFELLASRKPILSFGADDNDAHKILKEIINSKTHNYKVDVNTIKDSIYLLLEQDKENISTDSFSKYERRNLTREYLNIIYKEIK